MNKKEWKKAYRLIRIANREAWKVTMDKICYGTGLMFIGCNGEAKHIPIKGIYNADKNDK